MPVVPRLAGQTQAAPPSQLFSQLNPKTPSANRCKIAGTCPLCRSGEDNRCGSRPARLTSGRKAENASFAANGCAQTWRVDEPRRIYEQFPTLPAVPSRTTDLDAVLALSPSPTAPQQQVSIPAGESRGRFAISPEPNLAASKSQPGSQGGSPHSPALAVGSVADTAAGNVAALGPTTVTDSGSSRLRTGAGSGVGCEHRQPFRFGEG